MTLRHNHVRDITAQLLKEVCKDVKIEPHLQALTGEEMIERTANRTDEARLDVSARGFWQSGQVAFFDVRVFYSNAKKYQSVEIRKCYEMNEKEKKKMYNERIINVEHGTFTPLVFSANGGMGRECLKFYARLSEKLAEKRNQPYSIVASWVRRKITFSLMKSLCICLRGSRSLRDVNAVQSLAEDPVLSERYSEINVV